MDKAQKTIAEDTKEHAMAKTHQIIDIRPLLGDEADEFLKDIKTESGADDIMKEVKTESRADDILKEVKTEPIDVNVQNNVKPATEDPSKSKTNELSDENPANKFQNQSASLKVEPVEGSVHHFNIAPCPDINPDAGKQGNILSCPTVSGASMNLQQASNNIFTSLPTVLRTPDDEEEEDDVSSDEDNSVASDRTVDTQLLQDFNALRMKDKEELISEFQKILGQEAILEYKKYSGIELDSSFFLEMADWEVQSAVEIFHECGLPSQGSKGSVPNDNSREDGKQQRIPPQNTVKREPKDQNMRSNSPCKEQSKSKEKQKMQTCPSKSCRGKYDTWLEFERHWQNDHMEIILMFLCPFGYCHEKRKTKGGIFNHLFHNNHDGIEFRNPEQVRRLFKEVPFVIMYDNNKFYKTPTGVSDEMMVQLSIQLSSEPPAYTIYEDEKNQIQAQLKAFLRDIGLSIPDNCSAFNLKSRKRKTSFDGNRQESSFGHPNQRESTKRKNESTNISFSNINSDNSSSSLVDQQDRTGDRIMEQLKGINIIKPVILYPGIHGTEIHVTTMEQVRSLKSRKCENSSEFMQ